MTRRALVTTLLRERSALQTAIEAIEEYTATRLRRKMLQESCGDLPQRSRGRARSVAPRRRR